MSLWHTSTKPRPSREKSGISVLHADILSRIFEVAISLSERRPHKSQPPLNISHTCHAWRELVLAAASFWRELHCMQDIRDFRLGHLWLERSKDALLNIHIDANYSPRQKDAFDALLKRIMDSQARIKRLSLQTRTSHTPPLPLHDLSNLIDLELQCNFPVSIEEARTDWQSSSPFTTKPMLFLPAVIVIDQTVAPNLTTLRLMRVSKGEEAQAGVLALLQHCPNIVDFTLETHFPPQFDSILEMPLAILPKLKSLSFTALHYCHFLQYVKTPALCHLHVEARHQMTSQLVADDLCNLIHANRCEERIHSARFEFAFIEEEQQIQLLKALIGVTSLHANFPTTNRVYNRMSFHAGHLCPMLEELRITQGPKEGVEAMLEMLTSRFDFSDRFRAIIWSDRLSLPDSDQIRAWTGFQQRVAEGRMALIFKPIKGRFVWPRS